MGSYAYCYHYTTCTKPGQWVVMCIVTITLSVQSHENERSCVLLPLHYLYKARKMRGHVYCYHYTTCAKQVKWAVMCIITITLPVQIQDSERHAYCYHYTTCTKPGQWAVMCIVTNTLSVQSHENERSCVLLPLHYQYKARTMSVIRIVTITLPVQNKENKRHVYCYHYTMCTKPWKWAVMCIVTITIPVQSQGNEWSCALLPLHYLYKAMKMSVHVCCYHYTTCTNPGQWAVMCIATITLHVQRQVNEPSCVLLPLHYLYKARTMSGHVYCYHYTTCTKQVKWAVMCIVTITLPVQSQDNERSCVLLPLHCLYKAR